MLPVYLTVKKLCKERGLSFNDVEAGIGVGKNTLYGLKRNYPSMDRIMQLADFFDVSVDFLLGRTDEENPREAIRANLGSENLKELEFDEFFSMDIKRDGQKITDRDKRILKAIVEAYFKESNV